MFYAIQRDARAALHALRATIRSLVTRGQTLESLTRQSDELVNAAIIFELRSEQARQQLEQQYRRAVATRRLWCARISCVCVCGLVCIYFLIL